VPHSPHPAQRPTHRGDGTPHPEHLYVALARLMAATVPRGV
jgi:hypothetical protein